MEKMTTDKYSYKPYNQIFPELFKKEKERILSLLGRGVLIEHVGSTAILGLGGKGIIDIAIAVNKEEMESVSSSLQELGYEFRPTFSTPTRFYFIIYLPDLEEKNRRYHMHLTSFESKEWRELIDFRDYLIDYPEQANMYGELKKEAATCANQEGKIYRKIKEPFIEKIKLILKDGYK